MAVHHNEPLAEYQFPAADPFFSDGMITFSQQRYIPRPRLPLPVARTTLPSHQRESHALHIEATTSGVPFLRAHALVCILIHFHRRVGYRHC